jgi:hypothetical protein
MFHRAYAAFRADTFTAIAILERTPTLEVMRAGISIWEKMDEDLVEALPTNSAQRFRQIAAIIGASGCLVSHGNAPLKAPALIGHVIAKSLSGWQSEALWVNP